MRHAIVGPIATALTIDLEGPGGDLGDSAADVFADVFGGARGVAADAVALWVEYDLGGGDWIAPAEIVDEIPDRSPAAQKRRRGGLERAGGVAKRAASKTSEDVETLAETPESFFESFAAFEPLAAAAHGVSALDAPLVVGAGEWRRVRVRVRFDGREGSRGGVVAAAWSEPTTIE